MTACLRDLGEEPFALGDVTAGDQTVTMVCTSGEGVGESVAEAFAFR